jgi:hypothetical protein
MHEWQIARSAGNGIQGDLHNFCGGLLVRQHIAKRSAHC